MTLTLERAQDLLQPLQQYPRVVSFCGIEAPGRSVTIAVTPNTNGQSSAGWCVVVSREGHNARILRNPTLPGVMRAMVRWFIAMTTHGSRLDLFLRMGWLRAEEVEAFRAILCRIRNEIGEEDETA